MSPASPAAPGPPPNAAPRAPRAARAAALAAAFDATDEQCRANGRANLPATPEEAAFRRWFLQQVVGQLDGAFPTAWGA